jgi:hypothetical protein
MNTVAFRSSVAAAAAALALVGCSGAGAGAARQALPVADSGARANAAQVAIDLDASSTGPVVSADVFGGSLDTWYDFTQPFVNPSLRGADMNLIRFPGGSESDVYHWENGGSLCDPGMGYITKNATFSNLVHLTVKPLHSDFAITLNYGSNRACNGGGEPSEAGAWVAYARSLGVAAQHYTVGNEVYGSWEYDLHAKKNDPVTYSDAVRTGYAPAVHQADPSAKLGVVVDTPNDKKWNAVVLRQAAPFDFVELHYYPQYDKDNDEFLLGSAIDTFAKDLRGLRGQMTAAGVSASTPIYLGEFNSDAGNMGKQSVSIVNGLYLGQMLGTSIDAGVPMATWWVSYGSCDQNGDFSKTLYGFQNFGSFALFSDGLPDAAEGCPHTPAIAAGTPFPPGRVMALYASTVAGATVRQVSVRASVGSAVRAYGYALGSGFAFVIFNNTLKPVSVVARVAHASRTSFAGTLTSYGKAQYDESRHNDWVGPVTRSLGTVAGSVPLVLEPYTMYALVLK